MDIIRGLLSYAISSVTGAARPLTVNASDELIVSIGGGTGAVDINLIEIAGSSVASTVVAGMVPCEDDIRQIAGVNVAATSVAGTLPVETDHRQVGGSAIAATSVAGTFPVETDHRQVAGNTIATTGITGTFPIEGTAADAASSDASNPLKMGAVVEEVPAGTGIVDDEQAHLITDLLRRLWTRSAAFDSLTTSDQVTNLNTDGTDYDQILIVDAEDDDVAAATYQYPNSAGREVGTRNKLGWLLTLEDVTSCALEADLGDGRWVDITTSLIDRNTSLTGYAASHFTSAAGVTTDFYVEIDQHYVGLKYRWEVVVPDATNQVYIKKVGRAN